MKSSRYNFILEKEDFLYCFNASTFKFFVLKKEYKNLLESLLSSPDDKLMDLPNFKNLLLEGRFYWMILKMSWTIFTKGTKAK